MMVRAGARQGKTPIPIPIFVAPLDDVEDNADVDNADVVDV